MERENKPRAFPAQQTIIGQIADAFTDRDHSRAHELGLQAAKDFAALNGWTLSRSGFGWEGLAKRSNARHDFLYGVTDSIDHSLSFKEGRYPVATIGQPYAGNDANVVVDVERITRAFGLEAHIPPAPLASFHYPGACRFIVYTRRGATVQWLPDQADPFGRFAELYPPTFREFIEESAITDDPPGDFIDDTRTLYRVGGPPESFHTLAALESFVALSNGSKEAVSAAKAVWKRFRLWRIARITALRAFDIEVMEERPNVHDPKSVRLYDVRAALQHGGRAS